MKKQIIVSGIQPTGNLHIGNYLGAVKNWVELQNSGKYEMYIFIADLHSLTGNMSPEDRRAQILRTSAELIAAGIDPDKTTFFVQSHVQEHTELSWIFNCVTPMGELKRMTQFKDKAGITQLRHKFPELRKEQKEMGKDEVAETQEKLDELFINSFLFHLNELENKANVGLFTYPILQAADILLYHGDTVPVGQDQVQHVELTRDIARWFNNRYGKYFLETKHLLTKVPKVMSLLDPNKKMSKSLGLGHVIELADEPEVIAKKLSKAVTATAGGEGAPGVQNLLLLLNQFGDKNIYQDFVTTEMDGTIRYGDLKKAVAEAISSYFADFRQKRAELLSHESKLEKILQKGADKSRPVAEKTMKDVRKMVGIR